MSTIQSPRPVNSAARSSFRKTLLWLHTWTGLTIGLAMLFLAVTGGVLVMRPNFDALVSGHLLLAPPCAAPLPLDDLAARAVAAHPAGKLESIEITADPRSSIAAKFSDKDYVYLNACSGQVLGIQNEYGGFFGVIDGLHRFRFLGNGRRTAGVFSATCLILIVIGGIVLWWPRKGASLKRAASFNPRLPGIARTLSLHKVVGLYAAALLLALTVTALPLSFDWAKGLIEVATGSPTENPPPPVALGAGHKPSGGMKAKANKAGQLAKAAAPRMPLQQLWLRTEAAAPTWQWAAISMPKKGVVGVEYLERGAPHADAKSHLFLDAATGQMLSLRPYASAMPLGRKVYLFIIAIHSGLVGGIPYQLALMLACLAVPVQAYSGFSPYIRKQLRKAANGDVPLKLVGKSMEAKDVFSFEFVHAKGKPLPAFSAGAHIDLRLGPDLLRQYSLCNDPKETHRYLICVQRRTDSRGGSQALHEQVRIGQVLQASAPKNHFPLAHAAEHSLLIAGGIGVTPILCMAERLSNTGADFAMHYCVRSMEGAAFADRINRSGFSRRVRFHVSEAGDRLDVDALLGAADRQSHIYVCGPPSLIDEVIDTARILGWAEANLHREYFVAEAHDTTQDAPFDVKLASSGQIIHVPQDQSVAQALAAHGVDVPVSCSEGVCGSCLTRVLEGEINHRDRVLSPDQRAGNTQFTPCCSRSVGPLLVLDL